MSNHLQLLLDKAVKALPPKSPVRDEITQAIAARAVYTERAKRAWETMRANKAKAEQPVAPVRTKGGKPVVATKPAKPVKMQLTASNKMRSARKPSVSATA